MPEAVSSNTTAALPVYAAMAITEKGNGEHLEERVRDIWIGRIEEVESKVLIR